MEEYKSCIPSDIRTHLADIMANDFELVHKQ